MDKRNKLVKIKEVLRNNFKVGEKVPIGRLQKAIMLNIGASERTIEDSLKLMCDFGFIVEVDNFVFKIQKIAEGGKQWKWN